jgi:hypothetical protein
VALKPMKHIIKNNTIEIKTFLLYFALSQVLIPLFLRGPENAGNLGPISQWRLFSFSYREYSQEIVDFYCDGREMPLIRSGHVRLKPTKLLKANPNSLFEGIDWSVLSPCKPNSYKVFYGLPYEFFLMEKSLPIIDEGRFE